MCVCLLSVRALMHRLSVVRGMFDMLSCDERDDSDEGRGYDKG